MSLIGLIKMRFLMSGDKKTQVNNRDWETVVSENCQTISEVRQSISGNLDVKCSFG